MRACTYELGAPRLAPRHLANKKTTASGGKVLGELFWECKLMCKLETNYRLNTNSVYRRGHKSPTNFCKWHFAFLN